MNKLGIWVIAAFFVFGVFSQNALGLAAESNYVTTEKESYDSGETIQISGFIKPQPTYYPVDITLLIQDSIGNIVTNDKLTPASDGTFETSIVALGPLWQEAGEYSIKANYLSQTTKTTFYFTKGADSAPTPKPLAFAQDGASKIPTDKGTLDVTLTIKPFPPDLRKPVMISFEFLEPNTDNPKSHIDYRVTIVQGGQDMHTTYKQHSHSGIDSFSYAFMVEGSYDIAVSLEGIDFSPIPKEVATFPIVIGTGERIMIDVVDVTVPESTQIPQWIKQVGEFWIEDKIDDAGFVQVIEYLVQEDIIRIPYAEAPEGEAATQIPSWIKSNTEFWVTGKISDDEFTIGLEWLINNGIIRV